MHYLESLRPDFTYASLDGGSLNPMFDEPERWASLVAALVHDAKLLYGHEQLEKVSALALDVAHHLMLTPGAYI